jgi:hypothetical protein
VPTGSLQDEELHNKRFYILVLFYTITKGSGFKGVLNKLLEITKRKKRKEKKSRVCIIE